MTVEYICWMELNYPYVPSQIRSDEVVYCKGHQHGVQPTQAQWNTCFNSLVLNAPNVPRSTITSYAEKKMKSKK